MTLNRRASDNATGRRAAPLHGASGCCRSSPKFAARSVWGDMQTTPQTPSIMVSKFVL